MSASTADPYAWELERELVICRVFDAPRELVFKVWTDAEHVSKWFGPNGFTCTTHEIDVRVGGRWRFDFRGPDGTLYTNRMVYLDIVPNQKIVADHGSDIDNDPHRFRVTVTFDEQTDKKTVVTLRQIHPTRAQRDAGLGFGAVELGYQTLDKCAAHIRSLQ